MATSFDKELLHKLTSYIRAGASRQSAAAACQLSPPKLMALMTFPRFAQAVRQAEFDAKVATEVDLRQKHPRDWLDRPKGSDREHAPVQVDSNAQAEASRELVANSDIDPTQVYLQAFPWLTPADEALLRNFVQLNLLADQCYQKIAVEGVARPSGAPHMLLSEFRNLSRTAADIAGRLGLSPRDRAMMRSTSPAAVLEEVDVRRINGVLGYGSEPTDFDSEGSDQGSED
jgi:hypothetical protein